MSHPSPRERPRIAFFDYPDVFEDFYPHYGVTQEEFSTTWAATGNHAFAAMLQTYVGDVTWYARTLSAARSVPTRHDRGFDVRFVRSSVVHRALWAGFYLSRHGWRLRPWERAWSIIATYTAPLSSALFRALRDDRPDLVFVQDYANGLFDLAVTAAHLTRRPLIAYHSGSLPEGYLARWPKRLSVQRADLLLVPSEAERHRLVAQFHVPVDRLRRTFTPIDLDLFSPGERTDRPYLLFVGRLDDPVKRVSAIIRAFQASAGLVAGVDLVIAGDGPDRGALELLAATAAPGRTKFVGWVTSDEEKVQLYRGARALVLASRSEGFPTVVGEAMACGVPVITTRVGAVGEWVRDGVTGWVLPPGGQDRLADAIHAVMRHDPPAAMRVAARAQALIDLSPASIGARLAADVDVLLSRRRRRSTH